MTPQAFIAKWSDANLRERAGSQSHFIDLCKVLGEKAPTDADPKGEWYAFEKGALKTGGGDGWADVWKRGCFAWEYKSPGKDLSAALKQLQYYVRSLENPPLLIVSDMERIELHTNWTNTVQEVHTLALEELADARLRQKLKWAFSETDVNELKPGTTREALTKEVAQEFVRLAQNLRDRGHDPEKVAHFVNRMVFCMFAEDVDLLPDKLFKKMLTASLEEPESFADNAQKLFAAMARKGGKVGFTQIDWFNGGVFEDDSALPLTRTDIKTALAAANRNWSNIDPSIMGTLFERGLDPGKRSQLGAHYTDPEKIMLIVNPVIVEPLTGEWEEKRVEIEKKIEQSRSARSPAARTRAFNEAGTLKTEFIERLRNFHVLDPACGSGNFLYLALKELKNIEHRVNIECEQLGLARGFPVVGPECVKGIEINPFAAELARVSVWIGEIQWMREHGFDASRNPILKPLETIECRDALLNEDGSEAEWPEADVIIGNPPFLGSKFMRKGRPATKRNPAIVGLGDRYVDQLFATHKARVPASSNLVTYWFWKGLARLAMQACDRVGLVATQSVRLGVSNAPIGNAIRSKTAEIYSAQQNDEWSIEGAQVRVAIFCFRRPSARGDGTYYLDGSAVERINADLTFGSDLLAVELLEENSDVAFQGVKTNGPFEIDAAVARSLLQMPLNPNELPNSEVVRRYAENDDVTMRDTDMWILDFTKYPSFEDASLFEQPFKIVQRVKVAREARSKGAATETLRLDKYWLMQRSRSELRKAIAPLSRVIGVPETSEHRLFRFLPSNMVFSGSLFVIAKDDDTTFGLLQSHHHDMWATGRGNRLGAGNQRRYNATRTFETFPFPEGLTPNIPAAQYANDPRAKAIAKAAARLNELRENWLNPPDLVKRVPEVCRAIPTASCPSTRRPPPTSRSARSPTSTTSGRLETWRGSTTPTATSTPPLPPPTAGRPTSPTSRSWSACSPSTRPAPQRNDSRARGVRPCGSDPMT